MVRRADPTKIRLSVFDYLDFRRFLRDLTAEFKAKREEFTVRAFAAKAGLKSPGLLKMIIDGDRRLTPEVAEGFCRAFELAGREKDYFHLLVRYNQTTDADQKRLIFDELNDVRPRSEKFNLGKRHLRYLTRDYYVTIREMVLLPDFCEDADWIASRCFPQISPAQAREAIETLLELGILERNSGGHLAQVQGVVRTGDRDTQAAEAYHYHEGVLNKARQALGALPQDERNYQSLTLSLPKSLTGEIVDHYLKFQDWVMARADEVGTSDEVYQVSFQMFPVTRKTGEGAK